MSPGGNGSAGHRPPRNTDPAWQMAEYLDSRLRLQDCDEASIARALLLMSELHGRSRVARACGMRSDAMRRQLDGTRPLYFETVLGVSRALGVQLRAEAGSSPPTAADDAHPPT